MISKNINYVKDYCSGCGACFFECPKNAINIIKKNDGSMLYESDDNCINCGKCLNVCPMHKKRCNQEETDFFYKAITTNKKTLEKSSSGRSSL